MFYCGLDLGQLSDPSACIILDARGEGEQRLYLCRHIEQYTLGTSYPTMVRAISGLLQREPLRGHSTLAIDHTSVGRPVYDLFTEARLRPIGITITGGTGWHMDPQASRQWFVSKIQLTGMVQKCLQSGRLQIGATLPYAQTLQHELRNFRVKISKAANETYEAREGARDDLVLSLAIALFVAEHQPRAKASKVLL